MFQRQSEQIAYDFLIFSTTAKRYWAKMTSAYQTAARLAIAAFRNTSIANILGEAGLRILRNRLLNITKSMITKLGYAIGLHIKVGRKTRLNRKR